MTSEALDGQLQSCYAARARPKCQFCCNICCICCIPWMVSPKCEEFHFCDSAWNIFL